MSSCCLMECAGKLALAGVAARLMMGLWRVLWPYVIAPMMGRSSVIRKVCHKGEYAVVTGATDGIGKAYALELARNGANLILIGRNASKLSDVRTEILADDECAGIDVRMVTFDFANCSNPADYDKIRTQISGLTVSVLVNCVGISYEMLSPLGDIENGDAVATDILHVNSLSVVLMSRMVLEQMVERHRGAIVNISSAAGVFPMAYLAVYGASKAFARSLTETIQVEYAGKGIHIQEVSPLFVSTKMTGMKPTFTCPSAADFAKSALGTLGLQEHSFGCLAHALQGELLFLVPRCIVKVMTKSLNGGLMKKQQRRKAKAQ